MTNDYFIITVFSHVVQGPVKRTSLLCSATTFPIVPLWVAAVLDDSYPAPKHR